MNKQTSISIVNLQPKKVVKKIKIFEIKIRIELLNNRGSEGKIVPSKDNVIHIK